MNVSDFLAPPWSSYKKTFYIGPDDPIDVDILKLEEKRDALKKYCDSIPESECSWSSLMPRVEQNESMAKLLIVLGDWVGSWLMHPPRGIGEGWFGPNHDLVILSRPPSGRSRVPKPSAGDLEVGTTLCPECYYPMGEPESPVHDLSRAEGTEVCAICASKKSTGRYR